MRRRAGSVQGGRMRIAVYAFDGITMFHLSIPQMVFGTVSRLGLADWKVSLFATASESAALSEDTADPAEGTSPAPSPPSSRAASIRTSEGYILGGLGGPELAGEADIVVVPAWFADGRPAGENLCSLLETAHARSACVVGLCLGTIPLAGAGLIGGRRAVTHWRAFEPLAREHPEIALDESVLYVDHGDVLTSAGAASGTRGQNLAHAGGPSRSSSRCRPPFLPDPDLHTRDRGPGRRLLGRAPGQDLRHRSPVDLLRRPGTSDQEIGLIDLTAATRGSSAPYSCQPSPLCAPPPSPGAYYQRKRNQGKPPWARPSSPWLTTASRPCTP